MLSCPDCGVHVDASAIVDYFMSEPKWDFYGEQGKRWKICVKPNFIHFRITLKNGQPSHRIAQCRV